MEVSKNVCSIADTTSVEEVLRDVGIVDDVSCSEYRLGSGIEAFGQLSEIIDDVFQDLSPCYLSLASCRVATFGY